MAYPSALPTGTVKVLGAAALELVGDGLEVKVEVTASQSLLWGSWRLESDPYEYQVPAGAPVVFPLPATDAGGYVDPADGEPVSWGPEYVVKVTVLDRDRKPIPNAVYFYGPFPVPADEMVVVEDTLTPSGGVFPPVAYQWVLTPPDFDFPPEAAIGDVGISYADGKLRYYRNVED